MYEKGYVLVRLHDMAEMTAGENGTKMTRKTLAVLLISRRLAVGCGRAVAKDPLVSGEGNDGPGSPGGDDRRGKRHKDDPQDHPSARGQKALCHVPG